MHVVDGLGLQVFVVVSQYWSAVQAGLHVVVGLGLQVFVAVSQYCPSEQAGLQADGVPSSLHAFVVVSQPFVHSVGVCSPLSPQTTRLSPTQNGLKVALSHCNGSFVVESESSQLGRQIKESNPAMNNSFLLLIP